MMTDVLRADNATRWHIARNQMMRLSALVQTKNRGVIGSQLAVVQGHAKDIANWRMTLGLEGLLKLASDRKFLVVKFRGLQW